MKRRFTFKGLALLTAGVLLCGTAFALSKGDSLISLSYLENIFIPSMVSQGTDLNDELLEETYDDAIARLESISRGEGDGESTYSADFSQRSFGRGDYIYLETGSSFYMMSGLATLNHNGAVVDVTLGESIASGTPLEAGHRYLVAEDTKALVMINSGLVKGGIQGSYMLEAAEEEAAPFIDVFATDWYHEAVDFAYFEELFSGMGDDRFAPMSSMDRSMMMTVLYHLAGSPEEERLAAASVFNDVPVNSWYYTFVSWAADKGVSAGTGDGMFSPAQPVTRQQVVVLLYNFATNYMGMNLNERGDLSVVADRDKIAFWAEEQMSWAVVTGVLEPSAQGNLEPERSATRAEVASMLMNFYKRYL